MERKEQQPNEQPNQQMIKKREVATVTERNEDGEVPNLEFWISLLKFRKKN